MFEILAAHPDGLAVADLAEQVGVPADELREDLLAFYTADVGTLLLGLSRPDVLEFVGADGDDDPATAEVVRIVEERPAEELGVQYVDAAELALVYTAAQGLLDLNPDDVELRGAAQVLTETMLGDPARPQLVQTRRGWEVDAGPPDTNRKLRTFLVSNFREYERLDEPFEPPADLARLLENQRSTTRVRVRIPHPARWAADFYGEHVETVAYDELTATLDLDLLPPVEHRIGLLLLIATTTTRRSTPPWTCDEGPPGRRPAGGSNPLAMRGAHRSAAWWRPRRLPLRRAR